MPTSNEIARKQNAFDRFGSWLNGTATATFLNIPIAPPKTRDEAEREAVSVAEGDAGKLAYLMRLIERRFRPGAQDIRLIDGKRITVIDKNNKKTVLTPDESAIVRYCWQKCCDDGTTEFSMGEAIVEADLPRSKETKLSKIFQADRRRKTPVCGLLFKKVPGERDLVEWLGPSVK